MQRSRIWAGRSTGPKGALMACLLRSGLGILITFAFPVAAEDAVLSRAAELDAAAAFERMKAALVGEWKGHLVELGSPVEATFYLTGNASSLVEDIRRPDKPRSRMHTVYHLADEELRLTHFCSFQNQPRLVASQVRDGGRTIDFELVDVANLSRSGNRYTHKMKVSFPDRNRASITYIGIDEGVEGTLTAQLFRVR